MKKILIIFIGAMLMLTGCVTTHTKGVAYPKLYEENNLTILMLPPINLSTAPEAKEYFMSTLTETANETGYYVLPLEVTTPFLKSEGLYDTEVISDDVLPQFKEHFNADMVLITKILEWDKSYYVVGGNVTVSLDFELKSTKTNESLWKYNGKIIYNTSGNSNNGLLAALVETAIKTATQDYVPIAKGINQKVFLTVPFGKYHSRTGLDKNDSVIVK